MILSEDAVADVVEVKLDFALVRLLHKRLTSQHEEQEQCGLPLESYYVLNEKLCFVNERGNLRSLGWLFS